MKIILDLYHKVNAWYVQQDEVMRFIFAGFIAFCIIAIPGWISIQIGDFLAGV